MTPSYLKEAEELANGITCDHDICDVGIKRIASALQAAEERGMERIVKAVEAESEKRRIANDTDNVNDAFTLMEMAARFASHPPVVKDGGKCCDKQFVYSGGEGTSHYCCPVHCCQPKEKEMTTKKLCKICGNLGHKTADCRVFDQPTPKCEHHSKSELRRIHTLKGVPMDGSCAVQEGGV